MEWISIWDKEPPKYETIIFCVGEIDDEQFHFGQLCGEEKLRKCEFHSDVERRWYDCDTATPIDERVTHWCNVPETKVRAK